MFSKRTLTTSALIFAFLNEVSFVNAHCQRDGVASSVFRSCGDIQDTLKECSDGKGTGCTCSVYSRQSSCYMDYITTYCNEWGYPGNEYMTANCGGGSGNKEYGNGDSIGFAPDSPNISKTAGVCEPPAHTPPPAIEEPQPQVTPAVPDSPEESPDAAPEASILSPAAPTDQPQIIPYPIEDSGNGQAYATTTVIEAALPTGQASADDGDCTGEKCDESAEGSGEFVPGMGADDEEVDLDDPNTPAILPIPGDVPQGNGTNGGDQIVSTLAGNGSDPLSSITDSRPTPKMFEGAASGRMSSNSDSVVLGVAVMLAAAVLG